MFFLCLLVGCLTAGVLCDIDSPGCGTNDVGFDYRTCPRPARIIGGQTTTPHSFPWMVSLQYRGFHRCGGSLLKGASDKWYILTAAHCLHGTSDTDWKVLLGVHDLSNPESSSQSLSIIAMMPHPLFIPLTLEYDIGLMQLATAPNVNSAAINFACMATSPAIPGEHCYVIGWGSTIVGGPPNDFLQVVDKPVMADTKCVNIYGSNDFHSSSMICAGYDEGGKDSCAFDNGGPLMCHRHNRMEIIGTVSWGFGCAEPNSPAVYSRTSVGLQWIRETINA